jgi:hypothetical protein
VKEARSTHIPPVAAEGLWRRRMALRCYGSTRTIVTAVGVIVQGHAILSVVLLRRSGCWWRRLLHWVSGSLHCDRASRVEMCSVWLED